MKYLKFKLYLFVLIAFQISFTDGKQVINVSEEIIQLELNETKITSNGLKITYIKNGMVNYQPSDKNADISSPSSGLSLFKLELERGLLKEMVDLSHGVGMVTNESTDFAGYKILYIDEKIVNKKSILVLQVKKIP